MQSGDCCPRKAGEHGNEGKLVSLAQIRLTLPALSPTKFPICADLCPYDSCAWSEWAFRSILGGMKALSSWAGHDIIFHSAWKVMTGSNPYRINVFLWRLHCFHGHTSSPACSLHRDMTNHSESHPAVLKPTHGIVLDEGCSSKPVYRRHETQFVASFRENLSEKAHSNMLLSMAFLWLLFV